MEVRLESIKSRQTVTPIHLEKFDMSELGLPKALPGASGRTYSMSNLKGSIVGLYLKATEIPLFPAEFVQTDRIALSAF